MGDPQYRNVAIERSHDGIAWLILNRPEKRNAMSPELQYDMEDAVDRLAEDKATKILILTGAGEAWCAGQDIRLYFRASPSFGSAPAHAR